MVIFNKFFRIFSPIFSLYFFLEVSLCFHVSDIIKIIKNIKIITWQTEQQKSLNISNSQSYSIKGRNGNKKVTIINVFPNEPFALSVENTSCDLSMFTNKNIYLR